MIADLKADSQRWWDERLALKSRDRWPSPSRHRFRWPRIAEYRKSTTHESRQYNGPTTEAGSGAQIGYKVAVSVPISQEVHDSYADELQQHQERDYSQPPDEYDWWREKPSSEYEPSDPSDLSAEYAQPRRYQESDRRTTPIKPFLLPSQKLVPRSTPTLRRRINRAKKDLPILLKRKRLNACADSGATHNMISKALAEDLECSVFKNDGICMFELPIAGQSVESIGKTSIPWHFPDEEDQGNTCEFFVFEELITPLIMGRAFLRLTNTLDKYKHRLQDRLSESLSTIPIDQMVWNSPREFALLS